MEVSDAPLMSDTSDIHELKKLVDELRRRDQRLRVFGAGGNFGHQYKLRPVICESELLQFERESGVILPDDFRRFITQIGDGGVGPYYGLRPMREAGGVGLSRPFRWTEETKLVDEDDEFFDQPGYLYLCEYGCGAFGMLVVNGHQYGQMWSYDACATISPNGQSFGEWYRSWVEEKLRRLDREPLVDRCRVGMKLIDIVEILGHPEKSWIAGDSSNEYYVCFRDAAASMRVDNNNHVTQVTRFDL